MPSIPRRAQCEGSSTFSPDAYFSAWSKEEYGPPYDNDFRKFIVRTFGLKPNDDYGYMAQHAEVTLLQAQTYVEFGGQGGLHGWYWEKEKRDQDGEGGGKKGILVSAMIPFYPSSNTLPPPRLWKQERMSHGGE